MPTLALQRDFTRFLSLDDSFPQYVEISFGDSAFTCASLLLAQQSLVFEDMIASSKGSLSLSWLAEYGMDSKGISNCFRILYGAKVTIDETTIAYLTVFACLFEIMDLYDLIFVWIQQNLTIRATMKLFKSADNLPNVTIIIPVLEILDEFVASNFSEFMLNFEENSCSLVECGPQLFRCILAHSISSCGESLLEWCLFSDSNASFIVDNIERVDFKKHFPRNEDFVKFVSFLSEKATSVEIMEKLVKLQQTYFSDKPKNKFSVLGSINSVATIQTFEDNNLCQDFKLFSIPNVPIHITEGDLGDHLPSDNLLHLHLMRASNLYKYSIIAVPSSETIQILHPVSVRRAKVHLHKHVRYGDVKLSTDSRVFLKHLPISCTKNDVARAFCYIGEVMEVEIIRHKRCGFVELDTIEEARLLLYLTANGANFKVKGKTVSIERFKFPVKNVKL